MSIFKGSGVALVTPFKNNGDVDYEKLEKIIEYQIENNTDSIIICGTTGEAPTLTIEEHLKVIGACVSIVNKRIPVIAGTGSNCTNSAINTSQNAQKLGVDGLLLVTPYYNKPTQAGLYKHYSHIASEVKLPIILYNVPSRTGLNIDPETVYKLYKDNENIIGIKEASGNISNAIKIMNLTDGKIDMYSGNDDQIVPILSIGGIGVISVLANIMPKDVHNMVMSYLNGNPNLSLNEQIRLLKLTKSLFLETNPIPVKKALELMKIIDGTLREPLYKMSEENTKTLKLEMEKLRLI